MDRDQDPDRSTFEGFGALLVRPAKVRDLDAVLEVERASFSLPWGRESFRSLIGLSRATFLVADVEGDIVGHAVAWWAGGEGEVANLAVLPRHRGRGVATLLLDHVLERARQEKLGALFLEVRTSNARALELYRRRGFEQVGVRPSYYRNPTEDARILRLDLTLPQAPGEGAARPADSSLRATGETQL